MKGFISYAHEDYAAFSEFKRHLRGIERAYGIDFWADKRITAGSIWSTKIADAIARAQVHLLLFSPAFIDSDFIFDHELPAINAKMAAGDLILPVVVSRCCWSAFVGALQAVPVDDRRHLRPILDWRPQARGHDAAREQLAEAISTHFGLTATSLFPWKRR